MTSSRRLLSLNVAVALLASSPALYAQHDAEMSATLGGSSGGCGACHATHEAGPTAQALRQDPLALSEYSGYDLSPASLSCLRCHATRSIRLRQSEFRTAGSIAIAQGKFLGSFLQDDHPLGKSGRPAGLPTGSESTADPWFGSVAIGSVMPPGGDAHNLECTTCHDPHSRTGSVISPEEERLVCGSCHNRTHSVGARHADVPCSGCHALHDAPAEHLVAQRDGNRLCESCHTPSGVPAPTSSSSERHWTIVSMLIAPGMNAHPSGRPGRCIECHPPH